MKNPISQTSGTTLIRSQAISAQFEKWVRANYITEQAFRHSQDGEVRHAWLGGYQAGESHAPKIVAFVLERLLETYHRAGFDLERCIADMVTNYRAGAPQALRVIEEGFEALAVRAEYRSRKGEGA